MSDRPSRPRLTLRWIDPPRAAEPVDPIDVLDRLRTGEDVTVAADPADAAIPTLVDQAARVAVVSEEVGESLDEATVDLLTLIGSGLTTAHAARLVHVSSRSAYRMLAEARRSLGVASTAEAVLAVRSHSPNR